MKKAILYIRVSTDRQAEEGFSLPAQETALRQYCKNKNIEVAALFKDDYSAKAGFDRPGYNQLKAFIAKNKNQISYLLVTQWSRFSRELMAAFGEFYNLKQAGIAVNAIEQPIDFSIPENLLTASIYFAMPQVENERLALRTIAGMREAIKQGKYIYTPPKGYKSNKLTKEIEVDDSIAEVVKWAFNEYSKGIYTAQEVRHAANKKGLNLSKQAFLNMLSNQTYLGKVYLKEYKEEPAKWFNASHKPIIDEHTFNKVQYLLKKKSKPYTQPKDQIQNAIPLRGHLLCPLCGRILTGGTPKGNGGKYPYYHCQPAKYGCKCRFSAKEAHSAITDYLKTFQPTEEIIALFQAVLADIFNSHEGDRHNNQKQIEEQINAINSRITKIEDDYADGNITVKVFNTLNEKFQAQKNELVMQHATMPKTPPDFNRYISYSSNLMQNLSNYYTAAIPSTQNRLIGLIFPEKLTFTGTEYKTTKTNEAFSLICSMGKGYKENSPAKIARLYSEAPPAGLEPATL
jgi:site-specific DNA recombinase